MIIMQTFTMARWQIVVKTSEATKQTKDQNDNKKQTNKTKTITTKRAEGAGVEKQITNVVVVVVVLFNLILMGLF